MKIFKTHQCSTVEEMAISELQKLLDILKVVKIDTKIPTLQKCNLKPLQPEDSLYELRNLINDYIFHIDMFGVFGVYTAATCYMIQLERLILHCEDMKLYYLLNCVNTTIAYIKHTCEKFMGNCTVKEILQRYVSDQLNVLIQILREFKTESGQPLCSIIFVDRRFTAKILYHILRSLADDVEFSDIKADFMVGYNNSPYNTTREGLYVAKQNKKVLTAFTNKDINLVVASNVLEEGIDIPNCTLVVKFNKLLNYRSYIQSKGRARHKDSYYYIMVKDKDAAKFYQNYTTYLKVEKVLNDFLVGQNTTRSDPSQMEIERMYNELEFPPYIVKSARVDLLSAVALLSQYCQSFSSDKYTTYCPEWYIEENNNNQVRVVILMPLPCPIKEPIQVDCY